MALLKTRNIFTIRWITILVSVSMLTGCSGMGMSLKNYDDPSDVCNPYRQTLMRTEVNLQKWVIAGAVGGAAVGAGVAAVSGKKKKDIILTAIGGSLLGGATGYLAGRQKATKNRAELLAVIDNDASTDSKRVIEITSAIKGLGQCRRHEIETVKEAFESGTISKAAALQSVNRIQVTSEKDNALITRILGRVDDHYNEYVNAKTEVLGKERGQVVTETATTAKPKLAKFDLVPVSGRFTIKNTANVRSGPSTKSEKLAALNAGDTIAVNGRTRDQNWYGCTYEGQQAFIHAALILKAEQPVSSDDPLSNLAAETEAAKETQTSVRTQTEQDIAELKILLS